MRPARGIPTLLALTVATVVTVATVTVVGVAGATPAVASPTGAGANGGDAVGLVVTYVSGDVGALDVRPGAADAVLRRLDADPSVARVEPDAVVRLASTAPMAPTAGTAATAPTDPWWFYQWGPVGVRAPEAWALAEGDPGVVVAVVDTGVDAGHPDLAGALVPGWDFVENDDDPADENGHGTAVAGIVAARAGNQLGGVGMCWRCSVLPLRVLDATGAGRSSDVALAIRHAADRGARVVNLSLAGPEPSYAVEAAVAYAREHGTVVVAAAGNAVDPAVSATHPHHPAATPGVVGVVAAQPNGEPFPWSNRGPWADLAAPGCNVATVRGGWHPSFCGTSSAAPVVAGAAALVAAAAPWASAAAIESALAAGAAPMAPDTVGAGHLDALASVLAARSAGPAGDGSPVDGAPGAVPAGDWRAAGTP